MRREAGQDRTKWKVTRQQDGLVGETNLSKMDRDDDGVEG